MANYQWQQKRFSLKELQKKLKGLDADLRKEKPMTRDEFNRERKNIQTKINLKKLEAAQISCQIEDLRIEKESLQKIVEMKTGISRQHQEELKTRRDALKEAQQAKNQVYSGGKIRNPKEKMQQVRLEIQQLRNQLQFGSISSSDERRTIRDIAAKEEEANLIKEYIESNADTLWESCDAARDKTIKTESEFEKARQDTGKAVQDRNAVRDRINELDKAQKDLSEEIKALSETKVKLDEDFRKKNRKRENLLKEKRGLEIEISARKSEDLRTQATQEDLSREEERREKEKQTADRKAAELRRQAEQAAVEKEERTRKRREKAMAAYAAMQMKVKAKATKPVAKVTSPSSGAPTPVVMANDPHRAEKALCESLIILCESKKPAGRKGRKKKKGVRISYRADYFAKFNQVGVKIPKYSKDLDDTIQALRERIQSYDEEEDEPEEVTAQEEEKVVEEEEATVEPQTEEVVPIEENRI